MAQNHSKFLILNSCFYLTFLMVILASIPFQSCKRSLDKNERILVSLKDSINSRQFTELLSDSLWSKRDAYDAAHNLMIPLHYSFSSDDISLQDAFHKHVKSFLEAEKNGNIRIEGLKELQYLSLLSRYLSLASSESPVSNQLYHFLNDRFDYYWTENPAWQWGRDDFQGGIKKRITWKLTHTDSTYQYYNAFHDADFYVLGLAADLLQYTPKKDTSRTKKFQGAADLFFEIFNQRLDKTARGWVFQKNIWRDHRDYAYSGFISRPGEHDEKHVAKNIQADASHSHRWPLWLLQISQVKRVKELQKRLKQQLLHVVIEEELSHKIGIPLLNNYMCGNNGYFRWNYATHKKTGYGPYELSGTFGLGYWSFLKGEKISDYYIMLSEAYPLRDSHKRLFKTISNRKRNKIIANVHENGLRKELAKMAAYLSRKDK